MNDNIKFLWSSKELICFRTLQDLIFKNMKNDNNLRLSRLLSFLMCLSIWLIAHGWLNENIHGQVMNPLLIPLVVKY